MVGCFLEGGFKGRADCYCFGSEWTKEYFYYLKEGFYLRELMNGSCEVSFWLKLSLKNEMFLNKLMRTGYKGAIADDGQD